MIFAVIVHSFRFLYISGSVKTPDPIFYEAREKAYKPSSYNDYGP